jgi:uncharacterized membrane protein
MSLNKTMIEIKNLDAKRYFSILLLLILLTDLVIFLNVPFLRQIFGSLCFMLTPGLLIIHILRLNKIEFLKKFVLSIGLSVAFLMFTGLLVNSLYLLISKPLSLASILITFSIILILLAFIAYKRNKSDFDIKDVFNFKLDLKDKITFLLIFPIIFPFLAIFGTYLMNIQGNNIIVLIIPFLMLAYVVILILEMDRIPNATYPIAVWMIGIALVLMLSLRTDHLMGGDIYTEYFVFKLALTHLHWDISEYQTATNACLSITILPVIYQQLLNFNNSEYIYKLLYQLIFSIMPLGLYILFKKYIGTLYAFLSSFFFIVQYQFINLLSMIRVGIALTLFILAIMVFFDDEIDKLNKKILFIILIFSVIISHYATAYIFFVLMLFSWLITTLINTIKKNKFEKNLTITVIILSFATIFLWFSQITATSLTDLAHFAMNTFSSLNNIFITETYHASEQRAFGVGLRGISEWINLIIYYISLSFIGIGMIYILRNRKTFNFETVYLSMVFVCATLLAAMIVIPYFSIGYGIDRLFLQVLVIISPAFVIGGSITFKFLKSRLKLILIVLVLFSLLMVNLGVVYQLFGVPHSIIFNSKGFQYDAVCFHDQEGVAAKWLKEYKDKNPIGTDRYGHERIRPERIYADGGFFGKNTTIREGYIFLRYCNVVEGKIMPGWKNVYSISNYSHLFIGKSRIYDNGGSEVWK